MAKNKLETWWFFLPHVEIHFLGQCFFFRSRPLGWAKKKRKQRETLQSKKQVEFAHTLRCTLFFSVFVFRKVNSWWGLLQILKLPSIFSTGQCSYVIIKLLWNHLAASFFFLAKHPKERFDDRQKQPAASQLSCTILSLPSWNHFLQLWQRIS